MDDLLLALGKFRWYVRYPAAALVLWVAWYMYSTPPGAYGIPAIFALCAVVITKEASPSLLLLCGAVWLWPADFWSTPLAQMTFGMIFAAVGSAVLGIAAPVLAFVLAINRVNAAYEDEKLARNPAQVSR